MWYLLSTVTEDHAMKKDKHIQILLFDEIDKEKNDTNSKIKL